MLTTGLPGPVHLMPGPQWRNGSDVPHLQLRGFGFKQRTRWFTKVWKEILRHQGIELSFCYGRPRSEMILMFTGVAAISLAKVQNPSSGQMDAGHCRCDVSTPN